MRLASFLLLLATLARAQDGGIPAKELDRQLDARMMASQRARLEKVREALREPLSPEACERARVFRAIYSPSFTLPSVVTFEFSQAHARLWLRTPSGRSADGGFELALVETELAPEPSAALLERLTTSNPEDLGDQPSVGADGIGLMGTVCSPGIPPHHFAGWDYTPSRRRDFFRALTDAARASLPQSGAFTAERTLEYLAPPGELIAADLPGPPRTIRLVGISAGEAEPFRALCSSVKPDEDLIIDLRNFSGAGTMFKPEFMQLDRRKGRTLWVAHPELAKDLINRFGVARGHFVTTLEAAEQKLRK